MFNAELHTFDIRNGKYLFECVDRSTKQMLNKKCNSKSSSLLCYDLVLTSK